MLFKCKQLNACFNLACKWKGKYHGWAPEEGWFILTNLEDLGLTITAYQKRFGIKEMFRDCKSGSYNLEGTRGVGQRLNTPILLIAIAYSSALHPRGKIKRMGVQSYVLSVKEAKRPSRRHSTFHVGLHGQTLVDSVEQDAEAVT